MYISHNLVVLVSEITYMQISVGLYLSSSGRLTRTHGADHRQTSLKKTQYLMTKLVPKNSRLEAKHEETDQDRMPETLLEGCRRSDKDTLGMWV